MIDEVFDSLPMIQWSNATKPIDEHIECYHDTFEGREIFNNIIASLESIHQK